MSDDNFMRAFYAWWIFVLVVGLGCLGLVVWGFIELINWITSK